MIAPESIRASDGQPLAVRATDLWFGYRRAWPVLKGVSLQVERGTICMLLGPSGTGKTTFLKLVRGLLRPQRGSLNVLGRQLSGGASMGRLGSSVAYIPQNLGLVRSLTVMDNVLTGALDRTPFIPSLFGAFRSEDREEARGILEALGIAHKAHEKAYDLSGGERQRVAIARALMQRAQLILADEFVAHLDFVLTTEVMDAVRQVASRGVTFIISLHDLDLVSRYGDKAAFFRDGKVVEECLAQQVDAAWVKEALT